MKTTRKLIIKSLASLLVMISINSCITKKADIAKSHSSERSHENIRIHENQSESFNITQTLAISDSGSQQYSLKIVPLDTFSFSIDHGFKGKAVSIELSGVMQQKRNKDVNISFAGTTQKESLSNKESQMKKEEGATTKSIKKSTWALIPLLICLSTLALIFYHYRRFLKITF